jgi:hypothetical protein
MEVSDGEGQSQGRPGQEGQAQEGQPVVVCEICGDPEEGHAYRHKFTPPGEQIDTRQFDRKRNKTPAAGESPSRRVPTSQGTAERGGMRPVTSPFDPVLRMALIDAGIITVEQLDEAAKKIAVFTDQVTGGTYRG